MDEDAVALRLGRLVIASARLELAVQHLAEFLGEPSAVGLSQLRQCKAIRRLSKNRPEAAEISAWTFKANELLNSRGELVHGGFLGRWEGDVMVPAYIAHKRGEVVDIDLARLDDLAESAHRLAAEGRRYSQKVFGELIERYGGEYIVE